jgi:acetyl-CoA C-acetyltransferase
MESMTNAPHLLNGSRTGTKFGSVTMLDHMQTDGSSIPYDGQAMGVFGESCVGQVRLHPRRAGCLRRRKRALVRRAPCSRVRSRPKSFPVVVAGRKGEVDDRHRRTAGQLRQSRRSPR